MSPPLREKWHQDVLWKGLEKRFMAFHWHGDIFDLLKVKVAGVWPTEITEEIAVEKLRLCLEGHPKAVLALRRFVAGVRRRIVYLPGNHDLDMWFSGPQELFKRYVAPLVGPLPKDLQKVTTYSACVAAKTTAPELARRFIAFLTRPAFKAKFAAAGLDYQE
jgi:hypothetical protein